MSDFDDSRDNPSGSNSLKSSQFVIPTKEPILKTTTTNVIEKEVKESIESPKEMKEEKQEFSQNLPEIHEENKQKNHVIKGREVTSYFIDLDINLSDKSGLNTDDFFNLFSLVEKATSLTDSVFKVDTPKISCTILSTNGNIYKWNDPNAISYAHKLSSDKAFTALLFSSNRTSTYSGELFQKFGPIDFQTEYDNVGICSTDGGVPIYKNGILAGSIGIAGDSPQVDKQIALTIVIAAGLQPSVISPQRPILDEVELSKRYSLVQNNRTFYVIFDTFEKKNFCEHVFSNAKEYFSKRTNSGNIKFICPKCFEMTKI